MGIAERHREKKVSKDIIQVSVLKLNGGYGCWAEQGKILLNLKFKLSIKYEGKHIF